MATSLFLAGEVPPASKMNPAGCILTAGSGLVFTTSVARTVDFTTEEFDNDSMFTPTSDTVVIQRDGVYQVNFAIVLPGGSTGICVVGIRRNTVTVIEDARAAAASVDRWTISDALSLTQGDGIDVRAFQNSGASRTMTSARLSVVQMARS